MSRNSFLSAFMLASCFITFSIRPSQTILFKIHTLPLVPQPPAQCLGVRLTPSSFNKPPVWGSQCGVTGTAVSSDCSLRLSSRTSVLPPHPVACPAFPLLAPFPSCTPSGMG